MSTEIFYMFPEIRKNYKIQEKHKLDHLHTSVSNFCAKEAKNFKNHDLSNLRMSFECQVSDFYTALKKKVPETIEFPPSMEFKKIPRICEFILEKH